jgi:hypothetical protein
VRIPSILIHNVVDICLSILENSIMNDTIVKYDYRHNVVDICLSILENSIMNDTIVKYDYRRLCKIFYDVINTSFYTSLIQVSILRVFNTNFHFNSIIFHKGFLS